ncbi:hypothetical protein [Paenibacillus taichungensis]|uniref:hypothetical protein n=1 Tax=Paenibacillus taichungensis TaxID=484184 RepID=UPI0028726CA5|nr:hypothetical protein [Paenibacillus taichungensis]MDR9748185.1 hypothetical protein [Paenibacillus taichungensis]
MNPKTLDKLQNAIVNGKDWNSILQSFAKNVSSNQGCSNMSGKHATENQGKNAVYAYK